MGKFLATSKNKDIMIRNRELSTSIIGTSENLQFTP